jgi:16S rRNA (cytosine1407-C5)-methyltransferase
MKKSNKRKEKGGKRHKVRSNFKRSRDQQGPAKFYTKDDIFISRMASILRMPKGKIKGMFSQRAVTTIRLNPLASNVNKIYKRLDDKGLDMKKVDWSPNTFIVSNKDKSELGKTEEYEKGLFYIQNLSSMLPVVALDPKPGEIVLDMCAAPGSKTTFIAAEMENQGEIVANDENFSRIKSLEQVISQFHVKNTKVRIGDGSTIGKSQPNYYDKVLLDAPCSGEGLIYLRTPKPLRFWNIKKIKIMEKVQKKLIVSAYDSLKPGGILIYSTCTLEPDENEGVVSYLLDKFKDAKLEDIGFIKDEKFEEYRPFVTNGITKWSGNEYNPITKKSTRIIPGKHMQGFYIAKIVKPLIKEA